MKKIIRPLLLILLPIIMIAFFVFDLGDFLSLDYLKEQKGQLITWYHANPLIAGIVFSVLYTLITALSLPGAAIMSLAGGAVFGLFWGVVMISFASTIGATLAFLLARFLFQDWIQNKFGHKLKTINDGIKKEGAFYLFTLRLVPLFPFFMINLVMALTPIKTWTFYWVSQVGMFAGTIVYINAGTQLGQIETLQDILSPSILASFLLLGIFPFIAKKLLDLFKHHHVYKKWQKPTSYDQNIVVIGAGAAGLVTAYISATVKAKVTLIEKNKMGGDCLNTGCVPSKALIRSAKLLSQIQRSKEFGIHTAKAEFSFSDIMQRIQRVIHKIAPHDSIERYTKLGVNVIQGEAKIKTPWQVEVTTEAGIQTITTRNIVIASGASPFVPPIPGIEKIDYLTSDHIWSLQTLPKRLLVLGGGPIGCELTQAFARLGSQVTQIEMLPRLMIREDEDISKIIMDQFSQEGINVLTEHKAKKFIVEDNEKCLICEDISQSKEVRLPFDQVLIAVGRSANLTGFGLETLDITIDRTINTNDFLQTNYPNIYAAGDVAGPYQFTHTAAHQAWYVAVNALFSPFKRFRADYSVIPWATFTAPEVARVGLNEKEAKQQKIPYEVTTYGIDDLDRAIADEEDHGLIKVLTVPNKDKILGVTIVSEHAGDLIAEYVLAMKQGIGLNKILGTIHIYPTFAEANKYVAGHWKKAHAPKKILQWLERFHKWRR